MKKLFQKLEFDDEFRDELLPILKEAVQDMKVINGTHYVKLWELATGIGINKLVLYRFILSFPDHFDAGEHVETKEKRTRNDSMTENLTGEKYTTREEERNKGYCVFEVYMDTGEKKFTKEWVKKQTKLLPIKEGDNVIATRLISFENGIDNEDIVRKKCEEYFTVSGVYWNKFIKEFMTDSPAGKHLIKDCKKLS